MDHEKIVDALLKDADLKTELYKLLGNVSEGASTFLSDPKYEDLRRTLIGLGIGGGLGGLFGGRRGAGMGGLLGGGAGFSSQWWLPWLLKLLDKDGAPTEMKFPEVANRVFAKWMSDQGRPLTDRPGPELFTPPLTDRPGPELFTPPMTSPVEEYSLYNRRVPRGVFVPPSWYE